MKVTLLKKSGKKEVINRVEFPAMIAAIRDGVVVKSVKMTREVYNLMEKHRQPDGQIATNWEGGIVLPRVCFAAEYINRKGEQQMMAYNGLVVLEVNDLKTYESAVEIRELAKKLPETMACFLGGSGRSVKIICRGEMFEKAEVRGLKAEVGRLRADGRGLKDDGRGKKAEVRSTWGAESLDTLILQPQERNLTVRFAALDYSASERINYAFRLSTDDQWNYIGHDRTATLLDMEPGTYLLEIRSTNADGEWQDNIRSITVIVKPTFWEAWYGQLLILLLVIGVVAAVVFTLIIYKAYQTPTTRNPREVSGIAGRRP